MFISSYDQLSVASSQSCFPCDLCHLPSHLAQTPSKPGASIFLSSIPSSLLHLPRRQQHVRSCVIATQANNQPNLNTPPPPRRHFFISSQPRSSPCQESSLMNDPTGVFILFLIQPPISAPDQNVDNISYWVQMSEHCFLVKNYRPSCSIF